MLVLMCMCSATAQCYVLINRATFEDKIAADIRTKISAVVDSLPEDLQASLRVG